MPDTVLGTGAAELGGQSPKRESQQPMKQELVRSKMQTFKLSRQQGGRLAPSPSDSSSYRGPTPSTCHQAVITRGLSTWRMMQGGGQSQNSWHSQKAGAEAGGWPWDKEEASAPLPGKESAKRKKGWSPCGEGTGTWGGPLPPCLLLRRGPPGALPPPPPACHPP